METQPSEKPELGLSKEGPTWQDLLGANNWEGLLNPLNDELRSLILRCGDFCQVTYDTFMSDANSPYSGGSRYAKADLLQKTAFPDEPERYDVVEFLYATSVVRDKKESNWMGYVAVTKDEVSKKLGRREVYVAWRGTISDYEWVNVLGIQLQSAKLMLCPGTSDKNDNDVEEEPKVMRGWLAIYNSDNDQSPFTKTSARTQLLIILENLIQKYEDEILSITFGGHSLGAALAILAAFDVAENLTTNTKISVTAFVFGSPRVGNNSFKKRLNSHSNLKILHVKNAIDTIPLYPLRIMGYEDIGVELEIFSGKSPYLKKSMKVDDWHNLQGMLHVINGWHGIKREFKLVNITRSLALVNKSCDFLRPECGIPPCWWIEKNKGMVLDEYGKWILPRPEGYPEGEEFVKPLYS